MSLLQPYLQFVETLHPTALQRLEGASEEEIERLQALARTPFPPLFREYLQRMGHQNALLLYDTAFQAISDLIALYEDYERENTPFEPGTILMAYSGEIGELVLNTLEDAADPPVYVAHDGKLEYRFAAHFSTHLYRQAFQEYTIGRWPFSGLLELKAPGASLEQVSSILPQHGLEILPFSDTSVVCARSSHGQVIAKHIKKKHWPALWLAGSQPFIERLRKAFGPDVRFQPSY